MRSGPCKNRAAPRHEYRLFQAEQLKNDSQFCHRESESIYCLPGPQTPQNGTAVGHMKISSRGLLNWILRAPKKNCEGLHSDVQLNCFSSSEKNRKLNCEVDRFEMQHSV
jgi:hypothetical protein